MDASQHVQALFISLASSTDNFLVGLSVGLTRKPLSLKVLWGIAACNAVGCLVATSGGSVGAQYFMDQRTANRIACLAFAYLAWQEYSEAPPVGANSGGGSPCALAASRDGAVSLPKQQHVSLDLALPMTLNNLAGGVAAGVVGISPLWNFLYALLMSVVTMSFGYRLGKVFSGLGQHRSIAYGPIVIYLALALQAVLEAIDSFLTFMIDDDEEENL